MSVEQECALTLDERQVAIARFGYVGLWQTPGGTAELDARVSNGMRNCQQQRIAADVTLRAKSR